MKPLLMSVSRDNNVLKSKRRTLLRKKRLDDSEALNEHARSSGALKRRRLTDTNLRRAFRTHRECSARVYTHVLRKSGVD